MDARPNLMATTFSHVDFLVRQGWHLQLWDDRYSKGIWPAVFPSEQHLNEFCDATSDGDNEAINACDYVLGVDWMPAVVHNSVFAALSSLDARLSNILGVAPVQMMARNYIWSHPYDGAVTEALIYFYDQRQAWANKGTTEYVKLPARWQDASAFFETLEDGGAS